MGELHRARCGESVWGFHALKRVHQQGSSPSPILLGFNGGFITQARLIEHWPLVIELNLQPHSHPQMSRGWDQKFQPSNQLVGSPGNQPPSLGVVQKSPH